MTKREQEILNYIREDPFISQADIASRTGITRSSVAVHITNLMKKGLLRGRAYVLSNDSYVVAIGTANVDIVGMPKDPLVRFDNNSGTVKTSIGGTCKNVAENLLRLDVGVELITAFSDDYYGNLFLDACKETGIPMKSSLFIRNNKSATTLSIMEHNRETQFSISDMSILEHITPDFIMSRADVIRGAKAIVIDANLREDTINYITSSFNSPIFASPVSLSKCTKLQNVLGKLYSIKASKQEAELLTGIEIKKYKDLKAAANVLLEKGVKQVFITLGAGGVFYANEQSRGRIPSIVDHVINDNGAEDAFMAGIVYAHLNRFNIKHASQIGSAATKINSGSHEAVSTEMTNDLINDVVLEAF